MIWKEIAFAVIGYLSGSILFCKILPKIFCGVDVEALGEDHNPGTSNTFKHAGIGIGILCLVLELSKGILPVFSAVLVCGYQNLIFPLIMAAPALGHAFPVFFGFRGGKAIAVTFGVLIALSPAEPFPLVLLCALYLFFSLIFIINPNDKRTIVTFFCFAAGNLIMFMLGKLRAEIAIGCIGISLIVLYKNRIKELITTKDIHFAFFRSK